MFGKKKKEEVKKVEKPNRFKIDNAFENCQNTIQTLLDQYQGKIDNYLATMVSLKKQKRYQEADRYKTKMKRVLASQAKMEGLLDQVEQFKFMVDEAFAKNEVYGSLSTALGETNKFDMSVEVKQMLKDMGEFEDNFTKNMSKLDNIFGNVSKKIGDISDESSVQLDGEIDALVNARLNALDEESTKQAEEDEEAFNF